MIQLITSLKDCMSTGEVAKHLHLSIGTVQRMVDTGQLKAWTTGGGHRRISAESLRIFEVSRHFKSSSVKNQFSGTVGVLVAKKNLNKFDLSEYISVLGMKYQKFDSILQIFSYLAKYEIEFLIVDYASLENNNDFELLKLINSKFIPDSYTLVLMPEDLCGCKRTNFDDFKIS